MSAGTFGALKHFAGRLPFVEELVAGYYCALDPATPMRVRGILLAALAYFIVRWRYRPLTWLWRFPGTWLYRRRCRDNRAVRALLAHYSSPPCGSGKSARQGDTQSLRGYCPKIGEQPTVSALPPATL